MKTKKRTLCYQWITLLVALSAGVLVIYIYSILFESSGFFKISGKPLLGQSPIVILILWLAFVACMVLFEALPYWYERKSYHIDDPWFLAWVKAGIPAMLLGIGAVVFALFGNTPWSYPVILLLLCPALIATWLKLYYRSSGYLRYLRRISSCSDIASQIADGMSSVGYSWMGYVKSIEGIEIDSDLEIHLAAYEIAGATKWASEMGYISEEKEWSELTSNLSREMSRRLQGADLSRNIKLNLETSSELFEKIKLTPSNLNTLAILERIKHGLDTSIKAITSSAFFDRKTAKMLFEIDERIPPPQENSHCKEENTCCCDIR